MNKRIIAIGLLTTLAVGQLQAEEEEGWVIGPAFKGGWSPDFTLALSLNYIEPDIHGVDGDIGGGLQLSLNCPWFQPPSGVIRQQFNYNKFDKDGIELTTFEINPRYYVDVSPTTRVGAGPGFGYMWTDADVGEENGMWTFQLGGDVEYRQGALFLGAGARYMLTENQSLGIDNRGADNWLVQLKAGVNF
jgi:hypothetical protein